MGQKVHPTSFRLGVIRDWGSRWFADKAAFADNILEDAKIRKIIDKEAENAMVSHVDIERTTKRVSVQIYAARPGMIIGRQGVQIEKIKEEIQNLIGDETKLAVDIKDVPTPAMDAQVVADNITLQLEKRASCRKVMKKAIQAVKDAGGEGVKIKCSGRLGGAEIARSEGYKFGKVPLQTIRADIDYGFSEARTTYGLIGVKVWIYKGEKFRRDVASRDNAEKEKKEK